MNVSACASLDETQTWNCLNLTGFKCINDLQLPLKNNRTTLNMELIELVYWTFVVLASAIKRERLSLKKLAK